MAWLLPIGKVTMAAHRCGTLGTRVPMAVGRDRATVKPPSGKQDKPRHATFSSDSEPEHHFAFPSGCIRQHMR
ncbi:hypothetical protein [Burkholderia cepacia]|uniref:Uncharacterized protein n=1 Tax=Burkholderia cepacia GG4 TaxID=1009846 RepID=A0A9W3K2C2_BURCE|nr:hypothetical protein [Burkholderia cepacia]AFQ49039.1 hypothetical protein GEM_2640 [Burkholderia cepacia GG4]